MISIIIPLFNKEKTILKVLENIFNQTYKDFEVILVDDGSTDNSLDLISQNFKNQENLIIIKKKNEGPGRARNEGVLSSSGNILLFLDADDYILPKYLHYISLFFKENPATELLIVGSQWMPSNIRKIPFFENEELKETSFNSYINSAGSQQLILIMNMFIMGCVSIRKETFIRLHGFSDLKNSNFGEDSFLWIKSLFNTNIVRTPEVHVQINENYSELGVNRKTDKPIPAYLLQKNTLLQISKNKEKVINLLNILAQHSFNYQTHKGYTLKSIKLILLFPNILFNSNISMIQGFKQIIFSIFKK